MVNFSIGPNGLMLTVAVSLLKRLLRQRRNRLLKSQVNPGEEVIMVKAVNY